MGIMTSRSRTFLRHRPSRDRHHVPRPLPVLLTLLLAAVLPGSVLAGDWYVDVTNPNCPGSGSPNDPFCAIQDGITAAANGDTVHVAPGTYVENIDFLGKAITVVGTGGSAVTTIDGNGAGSVVTFQNGEAADSVLDGFTITNGNASGVVCSSSSPTITDSRITGNGAWSWGGGLFCANSSVTISRTSVDGNDAGLGGGIACFGSAPTIADAIIQGNSAWGIWWGPYTFEPPMGGGIFCLASSATIAGSDILGNWASYGTGVYSELGSFSFITDSIVWGNALEDDGSGLIYASYSDIAGGWPGPPGNIDADPQFQNGGYLLSSSSPCIDAGTPTAAPTGTDLGGSPRFLDGDLDRVMRVDMGAHEFAHVQLVITGTPTPGGQLTFDTTGTAGLGFVRLAALADGEVLLRPFGPLFLDFAAPWSVVDVGVLPDQTVFKIPPGIVPPLALVFQDVAIDAVSGAGNTSNPVPVVIR